MKTKTLIVNPARREVKRGTATIRREYVRPKDELRRLLVRRVLGVIL